jgi:hypothetical protein
MMRILWLVAWLLPVPGFAQADQAEMLHRDGHVRLRVGVLPAGEVIIGQQTRFFVEILTDTWFSKAPAYPELLIEGAIALMPEQLGSNFSERIEGVAFAGQRRRYLIFPQRAGPLKIPSVQIRLGVSEDGRAGQVFTLQTPPLELNVVLPAAAEGIDGLVTTPQLRIRDEWKNPLEGLRVGDAVERRVQINAEQALGMLLPELAFLVPTGIAVYSDQPRLSDHVDRGQYRGERIESVTYVMQQPGEFTLPAIEVHWWNSAAGRLETEKLTEQTLWVAKPIGAEALVTPTSSEPSWRARAAQFLSALWAHRLTAALMLVLAIVAALLTRRLIPWLNERLQAILIRRRNSEVFFFKALERSVRRRETAAIVQNYWRWRDRLVADVPQLSREDWRRAADTSGFAVSWSEFERARYGSSETPSGRIGLRPPPPLRAFRTALFSQSKRGSVHRGLNPIDFDH